jgi:hypothetical protein
MSRATRRAGKPTRGPYARQPAENARPMTFNPHPNMGTQLGDTLQRLAFKGYASGRPQD